MRSKRHLSHSTWPRRNNGADNEEPPTQPARIPSRQTPPAREKGAAKEEPATWPTRVLIKRCNHRGTATCQRGTNDAANKPLANKMRLKTHNDAANDELTTLPTRRRAQKVQPTRKATCGQRGPHHMTKANHKHKDAVNEK